MGVIVKVCKSPTHFGNGDIEWNIILQLLYVCTDLVKKVHDILPLAGAKRFLHPTYHRYTQKIPTHTMNTHTMYTRTYRPWKCLSRSQQVFRRDFTLISLHKNRSTLDLKCCCRCAFHFCPSSQCISPSLCILLSLSHELSYSLTLPLSLFFPVPFHSSPWFTFCRFWS